MTTIWDFQMALTRRLWLWSGLSIAVGIILILLGQPFWTGFGIQGVAWGIVGAAIAWWGQRSTQRYRLTSDTIPERMRAARRLRRLLWINTGLDVLYLAGGVALALTLGNRDLVWLGHGWGIAIQGGFLFLFDWFHAHAVPLEGWLNGLKAFQGEEHLPFLWPGRQPAALLIHGFLGTPAEMRPLAAALHQAGWTVQGLLLPGFGPGIASLGQRSYKDWVTAIHSALMALKQKHSPVLLIGFSMGGALAISAASQTHPDGLILLAPSSQAPSSLQRGLGEVLRFFLPSTVQPLQNADFSNPQLQRLLSNLLPGMDLTDPQTQEEIRQLSVPTSLLGQAVKVGQGALRHAADIQCQTLIIQGRQDEVVKPENTRRLLQRFPIRPLYIEIEADHNLIRPEAGAWPIVEKAVLEFALSLTQPAREEV